VNAQFFSHEYASECVGWLEQHAVWHRHRGGFFDQFETQDLFRTGSPFVKLLGKFPELRATIACLCGVDVEEAAEISAHRLVSGQFIGIHTDEPRGDYETHRLVVILPSPGVKGHEGSLVLLDQKNWREAKHLAGYRAIGGQALLFPLHEQSYHAVSKVLFGTRYSLVFSFWATGVNNGAKISGGLTEPKPTRRVGPLREFIRPLEERAGGIRHSGTSLIAHLVGAYELLRGWNCAPYVCLAGLYHSVYGTKEFQDRSFSPDERQVVRKSIGTRAERLVYRYQATEKRQLRAQVRSASDSGNVVSEESGLRDLLLLDLANEVEQFEALDFRLSDAFYIVTLSNLLGIHLTLPRRHGVEQNSRIYLLGKSASHCHEQEMALEALGEMFGDHIVRLTDLDADRWLVEISPKAVAQERGDENLGATLRELSLPAATESCSIGLITKSTPTYVMFNHSMALVAWSAHLVDYSSPLSLVHLDSHADLGSPTAEYLGGTRFRCPLTLAEYNILDETDARRIVRDGYVGIGAFIVPAIAAGWFSHFYFVSPRQREECNGFVDIYAEYRMAFGRRFPVLKARWSSERSASSGELVRRIPAVRVPSCSIDTLLREQSEFVLDVDLDFFCNRFDRQHSCWCEACSMPEVSSNINRILHLADERRSQSRLSTWALSPGFCDSRHWASFLKHQLISWL
jgi:hypothetical protein